MDDPLTEDMSQDRPLLRVRNLCVQIRTPDATFRAVDDVSFEMNRGEVLALVGESGCGKTMTALAIMRLLPERVARIDGGEVWYTGRNLVDLSQREMLDIRGRNVGMIFQEPLSALNPVYSVGEQVAEVIRRHEKLSAQKAWLKSVDLIGSVGIPSPAQRARSYPHQLSGGMRQRVMIAIAIACNPSLVIADEPTTALDVSVQAQILRLLKRLQTERKIGILLITHDLGVVAEMADRVAVMYAAQIAEMNDVRSIFRTPLHPYTYALHRSIPRLKGPAKRLETIEGSVPDLAAVTEACRFMDRCPFRQPRCNSMQSLRVVRDGQQVRCCRSEELDLRIDGEEAAAVHSGESHE